jgi:thymidylate synthase (FAD)
LQSGSNYQGSDGFLPHEDGVELSRTERELQSTARRVYETRLRQGIAREQARKDLPLSTYTEAYWKIDLHNLLHFLKLRMDTHSQLEIREYAHVIGEKIVSKWVPIVWEAFVDFEQHDLRFSRIEREVVTALVGGDPTQARRIVESNGLLRVSEARTTTRNREREELEIKLRDLGLKVPW